MLQHAAWPRQTSHDRWAAFYSALQQNRLRRAAHFKALTESKYTNCALLLAYFRHTLSLYTRYSVKKATKSPRKYSLRHMIADTARRRSASWISNLGHSRSSAGKQFQRQDSIDHFEHRKPLLNYAVAWCEQLHVQTTRHTPFYCNKACRIPACTLPWCLL